VAGLGVAGAGVGGCVSAQTTAHATLADAPEAPTASQRTCGLLATQSQVRFGKPATCHDVGELVADGALVGSAVGA